MFQTTNQITFEYISCQRHGISTPNIKTYPWIAIIHNHPQFKWYSPLMIQHHRFIHPGLTCSWFLTGKGKAPDFSPGKSHGFSRWKSHCLTHGLTGLGCRLSSSYLCWTPAASTAQWRLPRWGKRYNPQRILEELKWCLKQWCFEEVWIIHCG